METCETFSALIEINAWTISENRAGPGPTGKKASNGRRPYSKGE